ncbi:MAG: nucleotidyl transferase AbiEii/AbiGii toxin family protein [Bdellovibrionaceae bacterium]|nr:nucleotidyl transferase AbiEii/AbiGii toxin family protein [Pseudobdellovibrionaceae bacterium]
MNPYKTAVSFRRALEDRIALKSKEAGIDIQRLRRDVAFDRLLVRLFSMPTPPWVLKGGYAMQLRTDSARTTKDIDLALKDAKFLFGDEDSKHLAIRDLLLKYASTDHQDYFEFRISEPTQELANAPEGGIRFNIEARLADRTFERFLLDIAAGDVWTEPLDLLKSNDLLEFAGFAPRDFPAIPKEQQFAEKLHAYSLPRPPDKPNSRVKDLVDMVLLIQEGLEPERTASFLVDTYKRRATHALDLFIQAPPDHWAKIYPKLADECGISTDLAEALKILSDFAKKLRV